MKFFDSSGSARLKRAAMPSIEVMSSFGTDRAGYFWKSGSHLRVGGDGMDGITARWRLLWMLLAPLCMLGPSVVVNGADQTAPASRGRAGIETVARGRAAVDALGAGLKRLAQAHSMGESELRELLEREEQLGVDQDGGLHYADPVPDPTMVVSWVEPPPVGIPSEAEVFALHSRPGARQMILLEFRGMRLQGTAWNRAYNGGRDIVAPPFDFDGDPGSFGEDERGVVQRVWRRVAEDFAPFDVDVTTERGGDPSIGREGTSDESYGIRVLISPVSRYFGHYGGLAYLNVFGELGDAHRTVLVFPDLLGESDKFLGEACSHEVGHTLGLTHDGSLTAGEYEPGHGYGQTGWAPIMGAAYYQNLTQWSRGEYFGANNRQDDLEVMVASGLKLRPDDHGDTSASATVIRSGIAVITTGIIGAGDDVDMFSVDAGAGHARFTLEVEEIGPDLDVSLELRDADGRLLGASNPADALGASIEIELTDGTYFVSVAGTGLGNPLSLGYPRYGSMGAYRLVSDVPVPPPPRPPPVAVISATSTAGISFVFDGSLSTAVGGQLRRFDWSFDDGVQLEGSLVSRTFASAGAHEVVLTVTDDRGRSNSAKRSLSVNAPPVAVLSALPASVVAGVPTSLSCSGTRDPDGTIVRWEWSFGDGTTAAVENPLKTYAQAGPYLVVLNVVDNTGASATASRSIVVEAGRLATFRIGPGGLSVVPLAGGRRSVQLTLVVTDSVGEPVSGAKVVGIWGGALAGSASAVTSSLGVAKLLSPPISSPGWVEFVLSGVSKTGFDRWFPGAGQPWSPVSINP